MDVVEITYEITRRDFAEANAAVFEASRRTALHLVGMIGSVILLCLLPLVYTKDPDWHYPFLVIPFAAYLFYLAVLAMSPFLYGLLEYRPLHLRYTARFTFEEIKVSGNYVVWLYQWPSFQVIKELKNIFVFHDGAMMFIFAKRYFSDAQIEALRGLIDQQYTLKQKI